MNASTSKTLEILREYCSWQRSRWSKMRPRRSRCIVSWEGTSSSKDGFPATQRDTQHGLQPRAWFAAWRCSPSPFQNPAWSECTMEVKVCTRFQRRHGDGWMDPISAIEEAQRPTGWPVGALDFPCAPEGATFSFLAPPLPGAVPVIPILLICTAEVKKKTQTKHLPWWHKGLQDDEV